MIIREWRGRVREARSDAYPWHFRDAVARELQRVPGFLGAHLGRRHERGEIEFLVLTCWQSMDAIRAFAGATVDEAVVKPDAVAALDRFDDKVRHYEVIEEVSPRRGA
jgi:heme-degrading monooxygenase HmoA